MFDGDDHFIRFAELRDVIPVIGLLYWLRRRKGFKVDASKFLVCSDECKIATLLSELSSFALIFALSR